MIAAETALIAALDADNLSAIEAALPMLGAGASSLRTDGVWRKTPEILDRLGNAIALADAARIRIRYLADRNQRRIDLLATAAGRFDCAPATYTRPSRAA
jgi:hypothetical protein